MLSARPGSRIVVGLLFGLGASVAACTSVLGGFEQGTGGATSASSVGGSSAGPGSGGAGEGGAGGGASGPSTYVCKWDSSSHRQLLSYPNLDVEEIATVSRPNASARVFTSEWDSKASLHRIGVHGGNGNDNAIYLSLDRPLDAGRLTKTSAGFLALQFSQGTGSYALVLVEVPDDADPIAAASVTQHVLVGPLGWDAGTKPVPSMGQITGKFVVTDDTPGAFQVEVALGIQNAGGERVGAFVRAKQGSAGKVFRFTSPGSFATDKEGRVTKLVHVPAALHPKGEARTYAYVGEPLSGGSLREYEVASTVTGLVPPRDLGGLLLLDVAVRPDALHVAGGSFDQSITLKTAPLPLSKLGAFTAADLVHAKPIDPAGYIPVFDSSAQLFGSLVSFVGPANDGNPPPMLYAFLDTSGPERGHGALPFTGKLEAGAVRNGIQRVASSSLPSANEDAVRRIDVAWTERQTVQGNQVLVVYGDTMQCLGAKP